MSRHFLGRRVDRLHMDALQGEQEGPEDQVGRAGGHRGLQLQGHQRIRIGQRSARAHHCRSVTIIIFVFELLYSGK